MVVPRTYGVLLVALWLVRCAGKSAAPTSGVPASGAGGGGAAVSPGGVAGGGKSGSSGSAGSDGGGGVNQRGGASGSGGSLNGGTSSGMKSSGGSGGLPNAGRPEAGGEPAAGEGGAPSEPLGDGFPCERDTCVPGEVCINCDFFGDALPLICAPDPELDEAGYDVRVQEAGCLGVNPEWECDGPEDCALGEHCVASLGLPYPLGACVSALPCEAPYGCVLCRSDADCPGTSTCTEERRALYGAQRFCAA